MRKMPKKKTIKKKEIVKLDKRVEGLVPTFKNAFTTSVINSYSPQEFNMVMGLIAALKNKGELEMEFDVDTLTLMAGRSVKEKAGRKLEFIESVLFSDEKNNAKYQYTNEDGDVIIEKVQFFDVVSINKTKKIVKIKLSSNNFVQFLFNNFEEGGFTKIDFSIFHTITSSRAKKLYLLIAQNASMGNRNFSIEELRELLETKEEEKDNTHNQFIANNLRRTFQFLQEATVGYYDLEMKIIRDADKEPTNVIFNIKQLKKGPQPNRPRKQVEPLETGKLEDKMTETSDEEILNMLKEKF